MRFRCLHDEIKGAIDAKSYVNLPAHSSTRIEDRDDSKIKKSGDVRQKGMDEFL
jgi:hypothetical protein